MAASRLRLPMKHQGHMRSLTTSTVTVGWVGWVDMVVVLHLVWLEHCSGMRHALVQSTVRLQEEKCTA